MINCNALLAINKDTKRKFIIGVDKSDSPKLYNMIGDGYGLPLNGICVKIPIKRILQVNSGRYYIMLGKRNKYDRAYVYINVNDYIEDGIVKNKYIKVDYFLDCTLRSFTDTLKVLWQIYGNRIEDNLARLYINLLFRWKGGEI